MRTHKHPLSWCPVVVFSLTTLSSAVVRFCPLHSTAEGCYSDSGCPGHWKCSISSPTSLSSCGPAISRILASLQVVYYLLIDVNKVERVEHSLKLRNN